MKVVTYSRVSTSHHQQNPEVQTHELRRYCQSRDWTITHEITDHGFSGGSDSRPGLKQLLGLTRNKEVDAVVVVNLDRLFRSIKHLVGTLGEFQSLGIQFIAIRDNVDYTTPSGRLFVHIIGCLAEFQRSMLRERTMAGLAHAKAQGKTLGRPRAVLPLERIRFLRGQGESVRAIARKVGHSKSVVAKALQASETGARNGALKNQGFHLLAAVCFQPDSPSVL